MNHEELERDGFTYSMMFKKTLTDGGDLKHLGFKSNGLGLVSEDTWLKSTLKLARGFGIFDLPVIREEDDNSVSHTFYFRKNSDLSKFVLAMNGNQNTASPDEYMLIHFMLEDDEMGEVLSSYQEAVEIFSLNYDIDCEVFDVEPRGFSMACQSTADIAALEIAFVEGKIKETAYSLYHQSRQLPLFAPKFSL